MRIIGIILISAIPLIIGFCESARSKTALRQTEAVLAMTDEICGYIRYRAMTLDEIMEEICKSGRFSELGFDSWERAKGDFQSRIKDYIDNDRRIVMPNEQKEQLTAFLTALGQSDSSGEEAICALYRSKFSSFLGILQSQTPKKQKLCCSLGILGGLFSFILMI